MKLHKLAKYFPILEGEEFDLLVQDIKEHGQLEPITTVKGEILDGVNRCLACEQLGIEPIFDEYWGDDPLSYVISLNIRRRHLDVSQRAMLATEMLPEFEAKAKENLKEKQKEAVITQPRDEAGHFTEKGINYPLTVEESQENHYRARDDAAKEFGVSGRYIQSAKRIKEEASDKVEDIVKGKTTIGAVDSELRQAKAEERAAEKKEKAADKEVKQHPKCVKEYLDASGQYKEALQLAIKCAKRELFSLEAMQFIENRHEQIIELMRELEGTIDE